MADIETANQQLVGARGDRIFVMGAIHQMTPAEARRHAAWLVIVADVIDPDGTPFDEVLAAVRST